MKKGFALLLFLVVLLGGCKEKQAVVKETFTNPVLYADVPDLAE